MDDIHLKATILRLLSNSSLPVNPRHLYNDLARGLSVPEQQSRRVVTALAAAYQIKITDDCKPVLPAP